MASAILRPSFIAAGAGTRSKCDRIERPDLLFVCCGLVLYMVLLEHLIDIMQLNAALARTLHMDALDHEFESYLYR